MRIGFLGAGNMASAILRGMRDMEKGCYDISEAAVRRAEQELGARGFSSGEALCAWADIVVLAVKPQVLEGAVRPLAGALAGKAVASIAAGWSLERLASLLPESRLCRVMPNTPAMVGAGMAAIAKETTFAPAEFDCIREVFSAIGRVVVVEERLFDAVTAVSGSGPSRTPACARGSAAPARSNSPRRRRWARPRWSWKAGCTRLRCGTWSARRAEPRSTPSARWRKRACAPPSSPQSASARKSPGP